MRLPPTAARLKLIFLFEIKAQFERNYIYSYNYNERYAKDISRKIRSSQKLRGNAGEPLAPPPYGYKRNPENPKQWIIDDEAAEVIRDTSRGLGDVYKRQYV